MHSMRLCAMSLLWVLVVAHEAPSNSAPTLHSVAFNHTIELHPEEQHVPTDLKLQSLRPPPPMETPPDFKIFVGISAFRDGVRCGKTIFTCLKWASNRDRLFFGVVDQENPGDPLCVDEYCKLAKTEWPDATCKYQDHIRLDARAAQDSRGPAVARFYQQKLLRDEEFCLNLDAHMIFTDQWDANILEEWQSLKNEMAIFTSYPGSTNHIGTFGEDHVVQTTTYHLCGAQQTPNGCVGNCCKSLITHTFMPQMGALYAAGHSFGKCHSERRVHVDPYLLWIYDGEEFIRSANLWTHGYDLYSPGPRGAVIYHNNSAPPFPKFRHLEVDPEQKRIETEIGLNRFRLVFGLPTNGTVDATDLDLYRMGSVRSLEQYLEFAGVSFEGGFHRLENVCTQRHWVPYSDPTEVEELVRGWKMNPNATVKPKTSDDFLQLSRRHLAASPDNSPADSELHARKLASEME